MQDSEFSLIVFGSLHREMSFNQQNLSTVVIVSAVLNSSPVTCYLVQGRQATGNRYPLFFANENSPVSLSCNDTPACVLHHVAQTCISEMLFFCVSLSHTTSLLFKSDVLKC